MKLIISGGRDYMPNPDDYDRLGSLHAKYPVTEVVSGGASGADTLGEWWARRNNIPVKRFLPDWDNHGRAAGPIRNAKMAAYADAVVLFPGGRGTQSMHDLARKAGIRIFDWRGR